MDTIRILHQTEPGYGWNFDSPDIPGLVGGSESYDPAYAKEAARLALTWATEERGLPASADLTFEHYVPAGVAAAA